MSAFMLSLLSPVLRTMVCGNFSESIRKEISLNDVEADVWFKLVRLACGKEGLVTENAEELLALGELADRLQMEEVRAMVEDKLSKELTVDNCIDIFQRSEGTGLEVLHKNCFKILREHFDVISQTSDFLKLIEEAMCNLLEEDELWVDSEEEVFEAVAKWLRDNHQGKRGDALLRKIRFGVVSPEYLVGLASAVLPGQTELKELAGEALVKKNGERRDGMWDGLERLCDKWNVARVKARIIGADVLKNPQCVAVDKDGRILVSDSQLHQVIVFNRDGSVARRIGSYGTAAGQFDLPKGVAVDRQDHIIVADFRNHRIQVLNGDGSVSRCFGSWGKQVGQLNGPWGVAIDDDGHIVVAEWCNHRVQVFDADGYVVRCLGSFGEAIGQLGCPMGVAVDRAGRIVVADVRNHRVQVFNNDGSVALCLGSEGDERAGQLKFPCGVAVDCAGRFVVVDRRKNHRFHVFNPDGSVARVLQGSGRGGSLGQLPCGVTVDEAGGCIIVVEGSLFGSSAGGDPLRIFSYGDFPCGGE